jgi:zinc/manganese transport system permease protein
MVENLPWWVLPSAAALILVATHTYLGLHVISRNVFFVDLALAQVAALGSTVAFLFGFDQGDPLTYYVSLGFAVVGAWFFAVARVPGDRVPQEAIIGLAFAVASAGAILLSAENPHGAEHLRDMMAGSILVVSAREVAHAAGFYAAIGVFHWVFRKPLLLLSTDRSAAEASGMRVRLWDFLFYLSFAVVITSSVRIAGVLLVFILLIAPAICGAMLATGVQARLLIGWGCGVLATIGGLLLSSHMDWPPAPAICCMFALILLAVAITGNIVLAAQRTRALAQTLLVLAALTALGFGMTRFLASEYAAKFRSATPDAQHTHGEPEHGLGDSRADSIAALHDDHEQVRARAAEQLGELGDVSVVEQLLSALQDPAASVKEKAAEALGKLGQPEASAALAAALEQRDADEWVQLREAIALGRCRDPRSVSALLALAQDADAKLVRSEALRAALELVGRPAAPRDPGQEEKTRQELTAWWTQHASDARWDTASKHFIVPP